MITCLLKVIISKILPACGKCFASFLRFKINYLHRDAFVIADRSRVNYFCLTATRYETLSLPNEVSVVQLIESATAKLEALTFSTTRGGLLFFFSSLHSRDKGFPHPPWCFQFVAKIQLSYGTQTLFSAPFVSQIKNIRFIRRLN